MTNIGLEDDVTSYTGPWLDEVLKPEGFSDLAARSVCAKDIFRADLVLMLGDAITKDAARVSAPLVLLYADELCREAELKSLTRGVPNKDWFQV
ncbi:hypothetical protein RRF57_009313 [Xylaria bambusicola]|uniref:Uncharacterized protein n=1 Tax=Xylaria bambusicola TaxID=326684 RepID=A0AAN7UJE4_9PEZI